MFNAKKFKAAMVERDYTQKSLARALGVTEKTIFRKMQSGDWRLFEMCKIIALFNLDAALVDSIFFENALKFNE